MSYSESWDLETVFPGGLASPQFKARLAKLKTQVATTQTAVDHWQFTTDQPDFDQFAKIVTELESIEAGLSQTGSFANMILSADAKNTQVGPIMNAIYLISNESNKIETALMQALVALTDNQFQQLTQKAEFQPIHFTLTEMRTQGRELLDGKTESLIDDLALDGFQGWSDHYDSLVAKTEFPLTENGKTTVYSAGQAQNKMQSDPDPKVRRAMFESWEENWGKNGSLFADTLNHLQGFRLSNYKAHGTTDFLHKPLEYNRMSHATLDAMWQAVDQNKQPFIDYLNRKAALFGLEKLGWQDQWAPVNVGGFKPSAYSFDEAAEFIQTNFAKVSPKMAAVAKHAFENSWIEAEDRPNKRPGGYMTGLPETDSFRIFMTFDGTPSGVSTLAHELGHGFHQMMIHDLPYWRQNYAMNVAETASTFAELVVADATVKAATSPEEKISLIDQKMSNPLAMFLDIHARYLFENSFYTRRQQGLVPVDEINDLMLKAQKTAYQNSLSTWDPVYWSDKQHFFFSDVPFYNFPYTFGYLFSAGIYARAQTDPDFEAHYIALLRDTANMTTEQLAKKHLGVDLTQPEFWESGIQLSINDVQEFLKLTEPYLNK